MTFRKKWSIVFMIAFAVLTFSACECEHEFSDWSVAKNPACDVSGANERVCGKCGVVENESIPALSHSFGEWSLKDKPTCTAEGADHRICVNCGKEELRIIDMLEHDYSGKTEIVKAATCTEQGIKHIMCKYCDAYVEEPIDIIAHIYDNGKITTSPTCTKEGVKTFTCTKCPATKTETVAKIAHSYNSGIITTAPTCTANGVKTFTCTGCTDAYTESVGATGHNYNSGVITVNSTCSSLGIKIYTCSTCKDEKTEYIEKLPHNYDSGIITKNPTCVNNGEKILTCQICKASVVETVWSPGHSFNDQLVCTICSAVGSLDSIMTYGEKIDSENVYWRSGISLNFDERTSKYKISFNFQDKNKTTYYKVPAVVEIKFVNDDGLEVYNAKKIIRSNNYNGSSAEIYINLSEVAGGLTTYGNAYVKVYSSGYFDFSEQTIRIYDDLPLKPISVQLPNLPTTIKEYSYSGKLQSSVMITSITYELYYGDSVKSYVTGEKLFDDDGGGFSDTTSVGWKLYDKEGYVIDSGTFYSPGIKAGEKFRNEEFISFDKVKPGGEYRLEILNVR